MKRTILSLAVVLNSILFLAPYARAEDDSNKEVMASYEKVRAALASDDLGAAKKEATTLTEQATAIKNDLIAKPAAALAKSSDLKAARGQFKSVSQAVIPLVKGKEGYYVIYCSMAKASWVQTDKAIQNPYYGKAMLTCGAVQGDASKDGTSAPETPAHGGGHGGCM